MQARYETGRSFFYCRSGSDLQRCDGVRTREYACMTRLDWSAIVVFYIDCPFDHKVLKPGEVIKIGRDECVCRPPLQCSAVKKEKKDEEEKPTEPRIEGINEEKCAVGGAFFFRSVFIISVSKRGHLHSKTTTEQISLQLFLSLHWKVLRKLQ